MKDVVLWKMFSLQMTIADQSTGLSLVCGSKTPSWCQLSSVASQQEMKKIYLQFYLAYNLLIHNTQCSLFKDKIFFLSFNDGQPYLLVLVFLLGKSLFFMMHLVYVDAVVTFVHVASWLELRKPFLWLYLKKNRPLIQSFCDELIRFCWANLDKKFVGNQTV